MLREFNSAFAVHPLPGQDTAEEIKASEMKQTVHGVVPDDHLLLCLQKGSLIGHELVWSSQGGKSLVKSYNLAKGVTKDDKAVMAIQQVNTHYDLIICCPKKGIMRYTQGR